MNLLLRRKRKAGGYHPVKIAILDSGIESSSPFRKRIKDYEDFVTPEDQVGIDKTGHGTKGVCLTFKVIPEAHVYVARVWDSQNSTSATPELVAKV